MLMFTSYVFAAADLNDAEIAHILVTANKVDIENGALAKKNTSNTSVYTFAARMVKEHTEILKQEEVLFTKLALIPLENSISKKLEMNGEQNLNKLRYFSEHMFEKNYVDAEIKFHQKLIQTVDDELLAHVKNVELKGMILNIRQVLISHLEHAKKIQESIGQEKH